MSLRATLLALPAVLACLAASASAGGPGDVLVVDVTGGGDYTDLQTAINAAEDGDTVLIRGFYNKVQSISLGAREISVVQEPPDTWQALSTLYVTGVPPSQEVFLANLSGFELVLENNAGRVVVESAQGLYDGVAVRNCQDVVFYSAQLHGWDHWDGCASDWMDGGPGLLVSNSNVALYHCTVQGGDGGVDDICWSGFDGCGGSGLVVEQGSAVFADDCTFLQGDPPCGFFPPVYVSADSTFTESQAPDSHFIGPFLAQAGTTISVRVQGTPGHVAYGLFGLEETRRVFPPTTGILHVRSFGVVQPLGTIPGNGLLTYQLDLPDAPLGFDCLRVWGQGLVSAPPGSGPAGAKAAQRWYLSNPKGIVVVR